MTPKIRDNSTERRRERREPGSKHDKERSERKEKERDPERTREHRKTSAHRHHRKSAPHKTRTDRSSRTSSSRGSTSPAADPKRRSSMPTQSNASADDPAAPLRSDSKSSLPYPTVSKEHAKEVIGPRPALAVFTPPTTDLNASKDRLTPTTKAPATSHTPTTPTTKAATTGTAPKATTNTVPNAPPSPPLTDQTPGNQKSTAGRTCAVEAILEEDTRPSSHRSPNIRVRVKTKKSEPNGHHSSASELTSPASPVKRRETAKLHKVKSSSAAPRRASSQPNRAKSPPKASQARPPPPPPLAEEETGNDSSDATSIAPRQPNIQHPGSQIPRALNLPVGDTAPLDVLVEQSPLSAATWQAAAPPPPPPPPPPTTFVAPRVDYLLQNGGLHQPVPRSFVLAGKPMAVQQGASPAHPSVLVSGLFDPYMQLLDDFEKVIRNNGSVAVATGYRSVARRLLDRLEAVFARDISNVLCKCCMCEHVNRDGADSRGISWGEILELVSGRRELPNWPPFSFMASPSGLGISLEMRTPMQKLDIDVPEEFRDHYIKQSRKTKQSVDRWLGRQNNDPTSPPEEVDDDTLTFAILTHLPAEQRPTFKDLLQIVDRPLEPPRRAPSPEKGVPPPPTPAPPARPRAESIVVAGQAICRLYRLGTAPRDPETAIFLLNNPSLHNALATLAAVSSDEWDILISGRFDGFLRSGADDISNMAQPPPAAAARSAFAKPPSAMPAAGYVNGHSSHNSATHSHPTIPNPAAGAPIAYDEETEIVTLAEVEREIYLGMEALEDAFEALHVKAEAMRNTLRQRSAGLAAAAQRRRGPAGEIGVRMGTPASAVGGAVAGAGAGIVIGIRGLPLAGAGGGAVGGAGGDGFSRWEAETDDGLGDWDGVSELAPDDSASNIASSRRRRPKRRTERRTPRLAHVGEEEDEAAAAADIDDNDDFDDVTTPGTASPTKPKH